MKRNNAGSSLVEIVAATAIMGILVGAVCTSLMFGLRLNEKTDAQLKAQLAVSSAVETLMAEGIDNANISNTSEKTINVSGNTVFIESGQHSVEYSKLDNKGNPVLDEDGTPVKVILSDVIIETVREKSDAEGEYPPYYKIIVKSKQGHAETVITKNEGEEETTEDVFVPLASVTTYIRKAVTQP